MATTEKRALMVLQEEGAAAPAAPPTSATPPAFFVILKPGQGSEGGKDQGILVANQDANMATTSTPGRPPTAPCVPSVKLAAKSSTQPENLPPESTCKSIKVTLDNNNMWNEFYRCKTEMILTKQGRRMFPYCRFRISGMEPFQRYILVMDITPVDNHRYRWTGQQWEVNGRAEPHVLGRVFIHPDSPSSGHYWMQNPVSFYKLKLTNNTLDQEGHVILHSKHRYLPRLHVVPADKATEVIQLNGPDVMTFTFPQTEFIAVTAYQNLRITQLKIDYNPFAKGFREDAPGHQPFRPRLEPPNASTEPPRFMSDSEDVAPLKKSLKSLLLNSEDVFVMDQELFSATDYAIGFLDNGISSAKSIEKDHSTKKQPQPAAPVEVLPETKQKAWRGIPEGSHQAGSSDQTHVDSILKEEEVELAVDRAVFQEPWPDTPVEEAKVRMPAKPGVAIKTPSDPTPVASSLEPQQASPGSWPVLSEGPGENGHDSSRSRPLAPPVETPFQKPVRLGKRPEPVPLPLLALFLKQRRLKPRPIAPKPSPSAPESPIPVPEPLSPVPVSLSPPPAVAPLSPAPALQLSAPALSSPTPMLLSPSCDRPENSGCLEGAGHQVPVPCGSTTSSTAPPAALSSSAKRKRKPKPRFRKHSRRAGRPETEKDMVIGGPRDVNMQPNLEDVEGMLFVSFTSKEALEFHLGDQPLNREVLPPQPQKTPEPPPKDDVPETEEEKIARLEIALLQDLKRIRHRQVIHPVLQEVGLKLNLLDPTLAIDLRYLGVCLPLPPPFLCTGDEGTSSGWMSSPDGAVAFISRTGKTTDFTKIKGWRDKFNINPDISSAKQEGNASLDGVLKNRSAFCSDMLDAYLANEGKLIDERAASFTQSTISPVVYQLPTKSTSYVRTLDSVLKKQTLSPTFPSSPFKPFSPLKKHTVPPRPKALARPKLTPSKLKPTPAHVAVTLASPVLTNYSSPASHDGKPAAKTKVVLKAQKAPASGPAAAPEDLPDKLHMKQDQAGSGRGVGLSKMLVKLMDLEDGALWEGRARTCITEERAEIALASLLTAQGASKTSPSVTRIMKRRAPPCFNDFCRLGCVCASLALECRQPTHCGKTECMFGCTCLKRKVVLLKAPPKKKKQEQEDLIFYGALGEDAPPKKKKKRRRMMAYTISQPEPHSEPATRVRTLWNGKDEADPEPLYIPEPVLFPSSAAPVLRQDPSGCNQHPPRPKVEDDRKDPVYLFFESKMTCARVRAYKSKTPSRQNLCPCKSVLCSGREDDPCHNFFESAPGKQGVLSMQSTLKTQPSKRLEIVSECKWGRRSDRNNVLRVVCEHMAQNCLSSPFRVGPYHVRPLSQKARNEDQGQSVTYKVCISQAPLAEGEAVEKEEVGSWSVNEDQPKVYKVGELEPPRRKVLPFLTGVSPAGILTACKKQCGVPAQGLIKVNGRSYPQAKLQLGQMGALHPANRLAAYITGRLQPIGQEVSAASTISKRPSLDATTVTVSTIQPPHWTAVPMTTSITTVTSVSSGSTIVIKPLVTKPPGGKVFTQFVVNKISSLPSISSPLLGGSAQKLALSTPLVVLGPCSPPRSYGTEQGAGGGASISTMVPPTEPARGSGYVPVTAHSCSSKTLPTLGSASCTGTPSPATFVKVPVAMPPASPITVLSISPSLRQEGSSDPKTTVSPSAGSMGPGPRMLLIPVSPSASGMRGPVPATRPSTPGVHLTAPPFLPLAPGQRMVLQPVRSSSGTTLYRHPNGHLIQLVPLSQLRAVQPGMVIRSPASMIRFPTPSASASSSAPSLKSPVSSTATVTGTTASVQVTSTAAMAGRSASPSGISTAATLVTSHASAPKLTSLTLNSLSPSLKTLPGFLGQTGTYTVRISPSAGSKETKLISVHPTGSPQGSAEVLSVPGTFTLLQLPKSHVALQPAPPTAVAGTSTPGKGDSATASLTRAGETPQGFQGLEVSQEVTPAGLVCADHSYTSGRSPPEGLQDGVIGSAPLQERLTVSPNQASLQKITPLATAHASATHSSSSKPPPKTPPRGAEVTAPSIHGSHMVSEEQCNSGLLSGVRAATKAKETTRNGPPCGMSEKRRPLEEGEVEAEVEVDLDVVGVSEDMTEDSEEESEDNSEDDAISVVSESEDSEEGEAVDIETVEELTEKINIARMKAAAMQRRLNKVRSVQDSKRAELKVRKKQEDEEGVSEVVVRMQHNVMERRRRGELRHLFDKLRQALGLQNMPKVSKVYILNQAISEIQAMVDQCDRLEEKKRMLSRQQAAYIRKISQTSGKSEDLIIRKLQDICAKQKSLEVQRKRKSSKQTMPQAPQEPATPEGRLAAPCSPGRRPNILSRRKPPAPSATALPGTLLSLVSSGTLVSGLGVGVANQQVLTIKGALQPVSTFLQPSKTPDMGGRLSAIPGVASVTINVPGISFPIRVKSPAAEVSPAGPGQVISSAVKTSPTARKTCTLPKIVSVKSLVPFPQKVEKKVAQPPASMQNSGNTEDHGTTSLEDGEVLEDQVTCGRQEEPGQGSASNLEEETLMSLLSEIAFLNQQTNSEDSRPQGATHGHCSPQEARNRLTETGEEETAAPKWAGRVGDLEGDDERSLSPLFLQLDEDLQRSKDTCPEEVKVQAEGEQCVKIVLEQGKQLQQGPDPTSAAVANSFGRQSPTSSIKGGALTPPPLLQMKVGSAAMAMDSKAKRGEKGCEVSWRPMPRLAPLGLKTSVSAQDSAMSSTKAPPDALSQIKDSMQAAS
ncbi:MAX dimerization protein MGA a isoform X2 [Megalops cyprinoides]|uniref:MAX dimerization protein MGA a isoform X2 n=1 Tax=Megalops cyprinoides TaxID=118141 RepID=UPI0018643A16|nr:MAX dimerization protein MGA a isoform X2 [Megalops cyprinoides]